MTDQERPTPPRNSLIAAVVCDAADAVTGWSEGARQLMGHRAQDIVGKPATALIDGDLAADAARLLSAEYAQEGEHQDGWPTTLRHRDGHPIDARIRVVALPDEHQGVSRHKLLLIEPLTLLSGEAAPSGEAVRPTAAVPPGETAVSLAEITAGAFEQLPWASILYDLDFRPLKVNRALTRLLGRPEADVLGTRPSDLIPHRGVEIEQILREVIALGKEVTRTLRLKLPGQIREHTWVAHFIPLKDDSGSVQWVCACGVDLTTQDQVREHLTLLDEASRSVGSTLDVVRTAQELVQVLVPAIADFATVDLLESVFGEHGPAPGVPAGTLTLRRVAMESILAGCPEAALRPGETEDFPEFTPHARCMATGKPLVTPFRTDPGFQEWAHINRQRMASVERFGIHSAMVIPLRARGTTLGVAVFTRHQHPDGFGTDDLLLGQEITARAAVCIDNALRYTRQRDTAVTLQKRLLPQRLPQQSALEVTGRYLPSDAQIGVGGDWYDVIPLSGARVALVVGDVVGHGVNAAATMGRLRTAVRTLADIELPPDELLAHLDDLVTRPFAPGSAADEESSQDTGTTCLYAVYDPVTQRCTLARAGHPQPALVTPDGSVSLVDVPAGPPLGLGNQPFESCEVELPPGSLLALYTNGLVERRGQDMDQGIGRLLQALAEPTASLERTCDTVVKALLPGRSEDDIALLLARTRSLAPDNIATWDFPADPTVVGRARERAVRQLAEWGLDELAYSTEIIVSELVTNGIRHAAGPIQLRLILESTLICEVTDHSNTYPHQRRARTFDEGGRGLFLVAQLSQRWGTRVTESGKIVWADQILPGAG